MADIRPGVRRLFRLSLRSPARARGDADDELHALLDARIADLEARGLSPALARDEALRRLGSSIADARERLHHSAEHRERLMATSERLRDFVQDVRHATRGLARTPGFTLVAVATLAIGIGATTALFSAVNALVLRPLPFRDPSALMSLSLTMPPTGDEPARTDMIWSYPKFAFFREAQSSFESLALYAGQEFNLTSGEARRVRGEWVGARYLSLLGLPPRVGRDFDPSLDAHPDAQREVILSDALWQRRFGADPDVIGRAVSIDGQPYEVVGVARPGFRGLTGQAELFVPLMTRTARELGGPFAHSYNLVGRRTADVSGGRAAADVAAIGARIDESFPSFQSAKASGGASRSATARALDDTRLSPLIRRSLLVLFGAVVLVLLIACVNIGNLLVGRAVARRREVAVRLALGAGRGRLMRLFLAESLVLAMAGAVTSLAVAWWGIRALRGVNPAALASQLRMDTTAAVGPSAISLDVTAFFFMLSVALLVGVAFGLVPALGATRTSLTPALKVADAVAVATRPRALNGRRVLVVMEVALAIILLAGSGLMLRSLGKLLAVNPGFDAHRVLTMRLSVPRGGGWRDSLSSLYDPVVERLAAVPGVVSVGLSNCIPLEGICNFTRMQPLDDPTSVQPESPGVGVRWATPNYFSAMSIPLRRGRRFSDADRDGSAKVVLLSESAAKAYWPTGDPIGKRVAVFQGGFAGGAEVIGIVGDVRTMPDSIPKPDVYLPYAQSPQPDVVVFVRTASDPLALASSLRRVVGEVAPDVPVYDARTMESRAVESMAQPRFTAILMGLFGFTALSLAVVGIWGVMSYLVGQRTREMGIRMALGADASRVMRSIVGEGLVLAVSGAMLGLVGAFLLTRVLRALLYEISPSDPTTYVAVVALSSAAAILASWIPARRATKVDPLVALRAE